jgi:hypothetical protein
MDLRDAATAIEDVINECADMCEPDTSVAGHNEQSLFSEDRLRCIIENKTKASAPCQASLVRLEDSMFTVNNVFEEVESTNFTWLTVFMLLPLLMSPLAIREGRRRRRTHQKFNDFCELIADNSQLTEAGKLS